MEWAHALGPRDRGPRIQRPAYLLSEAQKTAAFSKTKTFTTRPPPHLYRRWFENDRGIDAQQSDFALLIQDLLNDLCTTPAIARAWTGRWRCTKNKMSYFSMRRWAVTFMTTVRPDLILRMKDDAINVIPSGNSVAVMNGLRLSQLFSGEPALANTGVENAAARFQAGLAQQPSHFIVDVRGVVLRFEFRFDRRVMNETYISRAGYEKLLAELKMLEEAQTRSAQRNQVKRASKV